MIYQMPLVVQAGYDSTYTIALTDEVTEQPITTFTTADTPSATVWTGLQETIIFAPTVAWSSAPTGILTLSIAVSQTATLAPGRYRIGVTIATAGGQKVNAWQGFLVVEASPTTSPTTTTIYTMGRYPVYGSTDYTLTDIYPSIYEEFGATDVTGFARQLSLAREWIDRAILAHDRGGNWVVMGSGGYSPVSLYGGLGPNGTNVWLKQQLANNLLMVTPLLTRIVNYYALGLILEAAIGPESKESALLCRNPMRRPGA